MSSSRLFVSLFLVSCVAGLARAADPPSFNKSAEKLQAATLTVRIGAAPLPSKAEEGAGESARPEVAKLATRVVVYSGVSLGNGLAIAPLNAASSSRIRITLAGGEQTEAKARVLDEYSGLALLELAKQTTPGIELAEGLPEVGSWVLSAAAWGAERPVVSLGIVAGVDRTLGGASFPPLLQADLRTAETSSGAGLVNAEGKLLGIVVAADSPDERRGWTYAIPASHIRRLMRARPEKADDKSVVVLKRRRPSVGMVMETEAERVVVKRVEKGSPAEKAGIKVGDQILAADGVSIRSAYQAVQPVLVRQPGDTLTYLVQQKEGQKSIEVVLGGGVELPGLPERGLSNVVSPRVDLQLVGKGVVRSTTSGGQVRELYAPGNTPDNRPGEGAQPSVAESLKLLERALDGYRRVIEIQQSRLSKQDEERAASDKQMEALKAKIESLQKQIDVLMKKSND